MADYRTGEIPQAIVYWKNGTTTLNPGEIDSNFSQFTHSPGESEIEQLQLDGTWNNSVFEIPLVNVKFGVAMTDQTMGGSSGWSGLRRPMRIRMRTACDADGLLVAQADSQPEPGAIAVSGFPMVLDDIHFRGHNLLARWERQSANGDTLTLQYYFDHTQRTVPPTFAEELSIHDLQLQQVFAPMGRHTLAWGLNYRHSVDRLTNSAIIAFLPAREQQKWVALHVQDDIRLGEASTLTAGVRLEHNDYTGTEVLPNLRWSWKASENQLLWAAVSRAVRAPSRLDVDAYIPGQPPYLLDGGRGVRAEVADVVELGWRGRIGDSVSLSATAFHTRYDHLRTQEIDPSFTFLVFDSQMEGEVSGLELWGTWQVRPSWRLHGGLVLQDTQLRLKPGSNDFGAIAAEGHDPSSHWQLRSSWTLAERHELDLALRHVARLDRWDIPAYTTLDLRYGWRLRPDLELSVAAHNLFDDHGEYRDAVYRTQHEPRAFAQLRWEF